jgi:uncharacterized membrane protein YedE/YeeE
VIRVAVTLLGVCFGFLLCWAGAMQPEQIRRMLLLQDAYLYLMMFSAMAFGIGGLRLLRRAGATSLLTGERLSWSVEMPRRHHLAGATLFGLGWAVSDACPGPIAGQIGLANPLSIFTAVGVMAGVELYLRRSERPARTRTSPVAPGEAASSQSSA